MKKYLLVFVLIIISTTIEADSLVWKAQKGTSVVYLGGTIHLLREKDYPLPAEFDRAFNQSQIVTFETDINQLQSPKMIQYLLKNLSYPDQRTLASELSPETYQALEKYAAANGQALSFYRKAKPGLLMTTFLAIELQKMGATAPGIDSHFLQKAISANKQTLFLETPEEQITFLAQMGEGNEDAFYQSMLRDFSQFNQQMSQMLAAWRNGNEEELNRLAIQPLARDYPKMFKFLLVERNNRWLPIIESYFVSSEIELVLVGAAHLVGSQGIIAQLQAKGYQVTRL